jgi:hypothetical protein
MNPKPTGNISMRDLIAGWINEPKETVHILPPKAQVGEYFVVFVHKPQGVGGVPGTCDWCDAVMLYKEYRVIHYKVERIGDRYFDAIPRRPDYQINDNMCQTCYENHLVWFKGGFKAGLAMRKVLKRLNGGQ